MRFYPTPEHKEHSDLEKRIIDECEKRGIRVLDVPQYYHLSKEIMELYSKCFSNESLFIRNHPDLLLLGKESVFVDCKTTYRKDTGNIAIELSSFYWGTRLNDLGIKFYYCREESGDLLLFAPSYNPPEAVFIQPHWQDNEEICKTFRSYATYLKWYFDLEFPIYDVHRSSGSGDPFVIKGVERLTENPLSIYLDTIQLDPPSDLVEAIPQRGISDVE